MFSFANVYYRLRSVPICLLNLSNCGKESAIPAGHGVRIKTRDKRDRKIGKIETIPIKIFLSSTLLFFSPQFARAGMTILHGSSNSREETGLLAAKKLFSALAFVEPIEV